MKPCLALLWSLALLLPVQAATTINTTNKFAYGANLGWLDWRGDTNNGAVIGDYVCSGYVYAANVGWISLGNGAPTNGIQYLNLAAGDYGVNHDGKGSLRGFAWGANIGWINFESNGAPRVDLVTGRLGGSIYSANCGWISLSNSASAVQTDLIVPGTDADSDRIADAWELTYTNTLTAFTATSDTDGDGVSDRDEYFADTNPLNASDFLRITSLTHGSPTPSRTTLQWTSKPTRYYAIQNRPSFDAGSDWVDYTVFPFPGAGNAAFDESGDLRFYRIRAFRPLAP